MKFEVLITGFETKAQAEEFVKSYAEHNTQDMWVWLAKDEVRGRVDVLPMYVDREKTFPLAWNGNTVNMQLITQ